MNRIILTAALFFLTTSSFADFGIGLPLPYDDQDFACTDSFKANKYVNDFNIRISSFGGMELCNSSIDSKKLFNDLEIIEGGQFANGSLSNPLVGGIIKPTEYYNWMKSQTRSVRRGHDIPHATAYNQWGNFTMQNGWAALSTLGRVGTIIHEARHTAGYGHVSCHQGPYKGAYMAGCDSSFSYTGSHAVEMEYYTRVVLQGKNFHPVYKAMARMMAMGRSNFVFNQPAIKKKEVLVARGSFDDKLYIYDGKKLVTRDLPSVSKDFVLKRTSYGVALFDAGTKNAWGIDVYSNSSQAEKIKDDYSYYKLLRQYDMTIPDLTDLEEYDINDQRYLIAANSDGRFTSFDYLNGKWHPTTSQSVSQFERIITTSPNGKTGLWALSRTGEFFQIDPSRGNIGSVSGVWNNKYVSLTNWNGKLFAVDNQQTLIKVDDAGNETPFLAFKGLKISEIVSAPVYDAYEVEN